MGFVFVLGEGPHESLTAEGRADSSHGPALATLVRRLAGGPADVEFRGMSLKEFRQEHAIGLRGKHGLKKQTIAAMRAARNVGASGLAIVVDRDGRANASRLNAMRQGRDDYHQEGVACAVGVAVESFDAWMVVDANAMACATDDNKPQPHQNPESLSPGNAKGHAQRQLGDGLRQKYAAIAASTDLALLERMCPKGFGEFAQEVRTHLCPAIGDTH